MIDKNENKKRVILIAGFSASGKDTLAKGLEGRGYHLVVSSTTRPKRHYEQEGVDYNFKTEDEFLNSLLSEQMIEFRKYNTNYQGVESVWYYGTEFSELSGDRINVAVIDFLGINNFKQHESGFDVKSVFLKCSDETRRDRCIARGDYDKVEFDRRLKDDFEEMSNINNMNLVDIVIESDRPPEEILEFLIGEIEKETESL